MRNDKGPRIDLCGTSHVMVTGLDVRFAKQVISRVGRLISIQELMGSEIDDSPK